MRRRLFWTIVGVSAASGLLVLIGAVVSSQRAAVNATYEAMEKSTEEAAGFVQEIADQAETRPRVAMELLRILQGDTGPGLGRVLRTTGASEIDFAWITPDGELQSNNALFQRVSLNEDVLSQGKSQRTRSKGNELVVVTPDVIQLGDEEVVLLVGLARDAPVVRLGDQMQGLLLVVLGMAVLAAVLARLLSTQLAKRLEPLATASHELAEGDLSVRVPNLGDPDLDEVATAFNDMAEDLESTRKREREFILGVGHDLRTPLTTIGGYAEALEVGDINAEDLPRIGAVLGVQSRQLSRLIEDLATLARLEQPEFSLRMEEVDVSAHITEVVEGFRRHADEIGVGLIIEAEPGLIIETDADRVGQVSQNLVENALRFTPEMGEVSVKVYSSGAAVMVSVTDTGTGISEEDLPHVFDRDFVGSKRYVRNEGTGLGLSIVKGLVDRMGGSVRALSSLGRGTTIEVSLPATS